MSYIRTDLALESVNHYMESAGELSGVECSEREEGQIKITNVKINDKQGEEALGKRQGSYITIEFPEFSEQNNETHDKISEVLSEELNKLIKDERDAILVVGLGNEKITPDALGPKSVESLLVTRHIFSHLPKESTEGLGSVCAISPGVLGVTGIETVEIIKGVCERVKPSLIIAVDALASRSAKRVGRTIQLSDSGINPGSGVGNNRKALDKESLGAPVIAIGIPMVCDTATIAADVIDKLSEIIGRGGEDIESEKEKILEEIYADKTGRSIVTPKDIDAIILRTSKIIAKGINLSLHRGVSSEEIASLTS